MFVFSTKEQGAINQTNVHDTPRRNNCFGIRSVSFTTTTWLVLFMLTYDSFKLEYNSQKKTLNILILEYIFFSFSKLLM